MKLLLMMLVFAVIGCPGGEQNPQPSPTPSPSASPAPSPSPEQKCTLPSMPECGGPEGPDGVWGCCSEHEQPSFDNEIEKAITQLQKDRPDIFNGEAVLKEQEYMQGVVSILKKQGYCATQGGPGDEVGIKTTNSFSDQYDILLSNGSIRHHGFAVKCTPARF